MNVMKICFLIVIWKINNKSLLSQEIQEKTTEKSETNFQAHHHHQTSFYFTIFTLIYKSN